jgi:flagellar biosynthesis protein FliR
MFLDKIKSKLANSKVLHSKAIVSGVTVASIAIGNSMYAFADVNGIPVDASTFQPLVDAIKQIIVVVLPIGMGIMGLFLVIELVPGLIRKFF